MKRLEGKVAVITGAARGTGAVMARSFASEGACVLLADVRDEPGAQVADEIGDRAVYQHLDVTSEAEWQAGVSRAVGRFGGIDILVNNAAILLSGGGLRRLPVRSLLRLRWRFRPMRRRRPISRIPSMRSSELGPASGERSHRFAPCCSIEMN